MALEINDNSFKNEVLDSEIPVLVDFWASWCGPCIAIAPTIEEISNDFQGRAKIVKLNIDENEQTPTDYGIRNIPTLLFFKGGKLVDKIVGGVPKSEISSKLESLI